MAFFDGVAPTTPTASAPAASATSGGFFSSIAKPSTSTTSTPVSGGFFGSIAPKPSATPLASTESPYWAGADAAGDTFGPSATLDPSGKPLLDYKPEGAESTTTDQTRVDTNFNPLTPQPEPQSDIETPRTVSTPEKAQIKLNAGAPSSDVIDHAMALTVAGSNEPANLRPLSNTENENDASFEIDLDNQVKSGKISLFDAQKLEAANKGLPTPFIGTQPPGFWDKVVSVLQHVGEKVKDAFSPSSQTPATQTDQTENPDNVATNFDNYVKAGGSIQDEAPAKSWGDFLNRAINGQSDIKAAGDIPEFSMTQNGKNLGNGPGIESAVISGANAFIDTANDITNNFQKALASLSPQHTYSADDLIYSLKSALEATAAVPSAAFAGAAKLPGIIGLGAQAMNWAFGLASNTTVDGWQKLTPAIKALPGVSDGIKNDMITAGNELLPILAQFALAGLAHGTVADVNARLNDINASIEDKQNQNLPLTKIEQIVDQYNKAKTNFKNAVVSAVNEFKNIPNKQGGFARMPGKNTTVPDTDSVKENIKNSAGFDVQASIKNGDIPRESVYTKDNILTPEFAQGRIDDIAQKLDNFQKGLGGKFRAEVNPDNVTMDGNVPEELVEKANEILDSAEQVTNPDKNNKAKTPFSTATIRSLTPQEDHTSSKIKSMVAGKSDVETIAKTPFFVSNDGKERPLILSKDIVDKIQKDHGNINPENMAINAHDWDYVIKNVEGNPDKINLIKKIPNSDNYLTIAANRDNGFFTVTHYESEARNSNKLKNLLKNKGESLDNTGRPIVPSFATSPEGAASQLDRISGVGADKSNISPNDEKVNAKNKSTILGRTAGPKVSTEKARELLFKDIPEKDVRLIFDDTLKSTDSVHGRYTPGVKGILKPMIELSEKGGKVSIRTAYHESFHYIFDNVFSAEEKAEALNLAKSELGKIKDFGYKIIGYKTADIRAEEYLADKYARQKASENGFDGPLKSFFQKISDFVDHIVDTIKKVGQKIKDSYKNTPNKQGGFIKAGSGKPVEKSNEEMEHIGDLVNPELSEKLDEIEQRGNELQMRQEILDNTPASKLSKYANKRTGELPEVTGGGKSVFGKKGDDIVTELRFKDSEEARQAYTKYTSDKKTLQADIKQFKDDKKALLQSFKEDQIKNGPGAPEGKFDSEITKANKGVTPPTVRGGIHAPEMDLSKFKDIAAIRLGRDTLERNIEKVAGPYSEELKDFVIDPVRTNEVDRVKFNNDLRKQIRGKMKELGIKRGSDEDELIQRFGEGMMTREDLIKALPDTHEEVEQAADYFRKLYDDLINQWNEKRAQFDYKPIGKRPNYFRHFNDINQFTNAFGFLRSESQLPTEIAGQTAFFKPGKPFSTAELHRTGNRTSYSSMGGMDNYLETVSKQMFHIDSIQRGRALEKYIREVGTANSELKLANFVQNVQEWTNLVAGKAAMLDRAIESTVGRPVMKFMKGLSNLIGRNIIGGNISVALTHLVSTPLELATTDKVAFIRGLMQTLVSPLKQDPITHVDGVESSFLTRRYPEKYIQPSKFDKTQTVINYLFHLTDMFKSKLTVAGKYYEGIDKGLSKEEAMKQADIYAGKIIGDYSIGNRPNLMNTHTTQLIAQFQLGVNDNLSVLMHDIPHWEKGNKAKIAEKLIAFAIFSYLFNQVYKQVRGAGKGIDPIDAGLTLAGMNDEGKGQDFLSRLKLAGGDIAGELPFTSIAAGTFPLATAVVQPLENLVTGNNRTGAAETLASDLASPVGAGGQIKKSIQGIEAFEKGQTTSGTGQENQPVVGTPLNFVKGAIFGSTAFSGANTQNNQTNTLIGLLNANKNKATTEAEAEYSKMKAMNPADAEKAFNELQQTNPALAKTIIKIADEDKEGITLNERLVKELGVTDGQRAKYIAEQINTLPTKAAKASLWDRYVTLKIISPQVSQQLGPLLNK